jgi:hypothetical protein
LIQVSENEAVPFPAMATARVSCPATGDEPNHKLKCSEDVSFVKKNIK